MPQPFRQLNLHQFVDELARFHFTRRVTRVHMHHTQDPAKRDYRGLPSIDAMWRYHTRTMGWSDIAQHVTIAPDGTIWTGRDWNRDPASAVGYNDGVFMFEILGDFDSGHDRLEGDQRRAVIEVIARVQIRCGLPPDSLHFHREYTDQKSCPGTGITKAEILVEVRARRRALEGAREILGRSLAGVPAGSRLRSALAATEPRPTGGVRPFGPDALEPAPDDEGEPECGPRGDDGYDAPSRIERVPLEADERAARGFSPGELASLRPHVVNLNQGRFSNGGVIRTTPADVDAIFGEHLPRALREAQAEGRSLRILFWAHGGLVSEARGLQYALLTHRWWLRHHVYPIYFVWETGIWETLLNLLRGRPRTLEAARELNVDRVLEELAHRAGGPKVWGGMKHSAAAAVDPGGGALYVAQRLARFCRGEDGVELHAAGHSAGAVFHGHFIPTAMDEGAPGFRTLHYLAPAVRVDEFVRRIPPLLVPGGGVDALTVYTMQRRFELDDNCGGIYRKSLLYLIHFALEARRATPILGLEDSLREDPDVAALFGLGGHRGPHAVILSPTEAEHGRSASRSTTHGGFDNDAATMESILRRVAGLEDDDPIAPFPTEARRDFTFEDTGDVLPDELGAFGGTGDSGDGDRPARPDRPGRPDGEPYPSPHRPPDGRGAKRALCVGINAYPAPNTLRGCVPDAEAWAEELRALGFEVEMLVDGQATEAALRAKLRQLVGGARPGDALVFQYAGHGTQFPNPLDEEEAGGQGEALVPVDFGIGNFILDDELFEMMRGLADGASLTCIFDCCHSQTALRAALVRTLDLAAESGRQVTPRFIDPTPEMLQEYARRRGARRGRRGTGLREMHRTGDLKAVLFSACRDNEVAIEDGGHGVFTRRIVPLLRPAVRRAATNEQFHDEITRAFGDASSQHPGIDCADAARARPLLGLVDGRGAGE